MLNGKIAHDLAADRLSLLELHGYGRILGPINIRRDDDRLRSSGLEGRLMSSLNFVPSASKLPSIFLEGVSIVAVCIFDVSLEKCVRLPPIRSEQIVRRTLEDHRRVLRRLLRRYGDRILNMDSMSWITRFEAINIPLTKK
jgi:hypothetical protein